MSAHSAFDTLAKALNPNEEGEGQSLSETECVGGATIQVISRDQVTPLIEVEGPLLTDTHVNFKVRLINTRTKHRCHVLCVLFELGRDNKRKTLAIPPELNLRLLDHGSFGFYHIILIELVLDKHKVIGLQATPSTQCRKTTNKDLRPKTK